MKGFEELGEEFDRDIARAEGPGRDRRRRRRSERTERKEHVRRQKAGIVILLFLLVLFAILGALAVYAVKNDLLDFSRDADPEALLAISEGEIGVFLDGEYLEERGIIRNGKKYLSLDFAKEFRKNLYYDKNEELLLNTTHQGTQSWTKEDGLFEEDDRMYADLEILKGAPGLLIEEFEAPARLFLYTSVPEETVLKKKTRFRTEAQDHAEVISTLEEGTALKLYQREKEWSRVEWNGYVGFVKTEALSAGEGTENEPLQLSAGAEGEAEAAGEEEGFSYLTYDGRIILGFHQVTNTDANSKISEVLEASPGINVIAPTWFSLSGMSFTSLADPSYVAAAHEAGVRVWAVADNFNDPSFSPVNDSGTILGWTTRRTALAASLVRAAAEAGVDGLNIDFEQIPSELGEDFAQFIRELSLETHRAGLVLSVDNYVPRAYSEHYRRDVQGEFADYVLIMGYDENTSEIGPNASLDFVEEGITATIRDVPAEHVINALPFYTRIWQQQGGEVNNTAAGMNEARSFVESQGGSFTWSDQNGCNYAEFENGGARYFVWLEDDASLETKLKVMEANEIAGAGFWKLGMEDAGAWDVIGRYAAGTL